METSPLTHRSNDLVLLAARHTPTPILRPAVPRWDSKVERDVGRELDEEVTGFDSCAIMAGVVGPAVRVHACTLEVGEVVDEALGRQLFDLFVDDGDVDLSRWAEG